MRRMVGATNRRGLWFPFHHSGGGAITEDSRVFPKRNEDQRIRSHIIFFVALVIGVILAWLTSQVLLLIFAALVLATLLGAIADLIAFVPFISRKWALRLSVFVLLALVISVPMLFGMQATAEFDGLVRRIPELVDNAGNQLGVENLSQQLQGAWSGAWQDGVFSSIAGYTGNLVGVLSSAVLVLFGGIFIALDSDLYREGLLKLFPTENRGEVRKVIKDSGRALRLWLLGQLVAMLVVGAVTTAGLLLLDAPSALALGLLAGLLEFIPFAGPILAYGVALLVALTVDLQLVLWVTVLYVVLQQIESNILVPIIQKQTVALPPAMGLFALIAISSLFGPLGILLAVPMTVVALVAVQRLYVRDVLNEEVQSAGD